MALLAEYVDPDQLPALREASKVEKARVEAAR
jgi:hypothetical protein